MGDLRRALSTKLDLKPEDLEELVTSGLAHRHFRIRQQQGHVKTLARVPIHSQHGHKPDHNLNYQAACFKTLAASGRTPALIKTLSPCPSLPMGALIVEEISGRKPDLPQDLKLIAEALAHIHNLPLQPPRPPLAYHRNPIQDLKVEIQSQAQHLDQQTSRALAPELNWMHDFRPGKTPEPCRLVCTDTHPGNFLVRRTTSGKEEAFMVDLEKALFGSPSIDLAHASVYTSTTWELEGQIRLTNSQTQTFYQAYSKHARDAASIKPWFRPMRRLLLLRALTWCAMWRAQNAAWLEQDSTKSHKPSHQIQGRDQISHKVRHHIEERTAHFLKPETLDMIFHQEAALNL